MATRTILITGGAGYIGSHVCKALADAGHLPVSFDNLSSGHRWAVQWGPLEEGDLGDARRLDAVFQVHAPAAVIHLAGNIDVAESVRDPVKYNRTNVEGSRNLLAAMRARSVKRLVFSSSCAVYGEPDQLPLTERHPVKPNNPYGESKLAIERLLDDFRSTDGCRATSLRFFNAAGADPYGDTGEAHEPEAHLIPRVLQAIAGGETGFAVYGDDYATADGTCVRDYIHVSDLADAHSKALAALEEDRAASYNVGTGRGWSVKDVIAAAGRVTGKALEPVTAPRRPGDVQVLVADATKARTELGWRPNRPDLETQIKDAWNWLNRPKNF